MGTFNWPIRLESMDGAKSLEIEAMVDTGASYTIVPGKLLTDIGISPIDKISLVLADGGVLNGGSTRNHLREGHLYSASS